MSRPWQVGLIAASMLLSVVAESPAAVPSGFTDTLFVAVGSPTDLTFTPDGRMLVTSQGGTLRVYNAAGALLGSQTIPGNQICTNSERGLLGVAVDPSHAVNRLRLPLLHAAQARRRLQQRHPLRPSPR